MSQIKYKLKIFFLAFLCILVVTSISTTPKVLAGVEPTTPVPYVSTNRISGADRYETAAKVAAEGWKTTSDYAIVAAGMDENLVDALTVAPLAKLRNAPILFTEGYRLNPWAESELQRLQVKNVYVTSGSGVILKAVTARLSELGISVKSLGGADRFETAVNIATEINDIKPFEEIVLTTAWTNADALSIASIAAAQGFPILLADKNTLPESVSKYLDGIKTSIKQAYVLGSETVISEAVLLRMPNAERIAGDDRYATNREILKVFDSELKYGKVYLANGQDDHLVDALAVSPLAAQGLVPVVLTDIAIPDETGNYLKSYLAPKEITFLGGEAVVPSESLIGLTTALEYATDGFKLAGKDSITKKVISDNLNITGNNVTLENTIAAFSLFVRGNNVTLRNVDVLGTLFLDPGPNGVANLDNVNALNIVVLSGATQSIHFVDVTSDSLRVDSSSVVRVEGVGKTRITNTYVTSPAVLDAVSGDFGAVQIAQLSASEKVVELHGTFVQPIMLRGQATLLAGTDAKISNLVVAPRSSGQKVVLQGAFTNLNVNRQVQIDLGMNTTVASTQVNSTAILSAQSGSFGKVEIAKFSDGETEVELRGRFAQAILVSGQVTIKAADSASITKIEIAPVTKEQRVILKGHFTAVDVNEQAKLDLADQTVVDKLVTNSKTELTVPPTSSITTFDAKLTATEPKGGGIVNNFITQALPEIPQDDGSVNGGNTTPDPSDSNNTSHQADNKAVIAALAALTNSTIQGANSDLLNITSNLVLPTTGITGTTIKWDSSFLGTITTNGTVIRPAYLIGNKPVTLTATVSKGSVSQQKNFSVIVKKTTVKDIINSMSLNIVGSITQIELSVDENGCSATFNGALDKDYVNNLTINVSRNVTLRTRVLKLVETPLTVGSNTLQIKDLLGKDPGSNRALISTIKSYGGINVNGWLVDSSNNTVTPVTLSVN